MKKAQVKVQPLLLYFV